MRRLNKIVSAIVLICFLFNIVVFDFAVAQSLDYKNNSDKLAAASRIDDMGGIDLNRMVKIEYALQEYLLKTISDVSSVDEHAFRDVVRVNYKASEETIFNPAKLKFFFKEMKFVSGRFCVKCNVWDQYGHSTFYAVIPLVKTGKFFPVEVYTKDQAGDAYKNWETRGNSLVVKNTRDAMAAGRYGENNERVLDRFIQEQIDAGNFVEIKNRAKELGFDKIPGYNKPDSYWPKAVLFNNGPVRKFLKLLNVNISVLLKDKNIVFIRAMALPEITEDGVRISVKSHSSNNSLYFFLDDTVYFAILDANRERFKKTGFGDQAGDINELIGGNISKQVALLLIHELGVICGLPFTVNKEKGFLENDLDRAYRAYVPTTTREQLIEKFPSLAKLSPVNLDLNVATRDYASGDLSDDGITVTEVAFNASKMNSEELRIFTDIKGQWQAYEDAIKAGQNKKAFLQTENLKKILSNYQYQEVLIRALVNQDSSVRHTAWVVAASGAASVVKESLIREAVGSGRNFRAAYYLAIASGKLPLLPKDLDLSRLTVEMRYGRLAESSAIVTSIIRENRSLGKAARNTLFGIWTDIQFAMYDEVRDEKPVSPTIAPQQASSGEAAASGAAGQAAGSGVGGVAAGTVTSVSPDRKWATVDMGQGRTGRVTAREFYAFGDTEEFIGTGIVGQQIKCIVTGYDPNKGYIVSRRGFLNKLFAETWASGAINSEREFSGQVSGVLESNDAIVRVNFGEYQGQALILEGILRKNVSVRQKVTVKVKSCEIKDGGIAIALEGVNIPKFTPPPMPVNKVAPQEPPKYSSRDYIDLTPGRDRGLLRHIYPSADKPAAGTPSHKLELSDGVRGDGRLTVYTVAETRNGEIATQESDVDTITTYITVAGNFSQTSRLYYPRSTTWSDAKRIHGLMKDYIEANGFVGRSSNVKEYFESITSQPSVSVTPAATPQFTQPTPSQELKLYDSLFGGKISVFTAAKTREGEIASKESDVDHIVTRIEDLELLHRKGTTWATAIDTHELMKLYVEEGYFGDQLRQKFDLLQDNSAPAAAKNPISAANQKAQELRLADGKMTSMTLDEAAGYVYIQNEGDDMSSVIWEPDGWATLYSGHSKDSIKQDMIRKFDKEEGVNDSTRVNVEQSGNEIHISLSDGQSAALGSITINAAVQYVIEHKADITYVVVNNKQVEAYTYREARRATDDEIRTEIKRAVENFVGEGGLVSIDHCGNILTIQRSGAAAVYPAMNVDKEKLLNSMQPAQGLFIARLNSMDMSEDEKSKIIGKLSSGAESFVNSFLDNKYVLAWANYEKVIYWADDSVRQMWRDLLKEILSETIKSDPSVRPIAIRFAEYANANADAKDSAQRAAKQDALVDIKEVLGGLNIPFPGTEGGTVSTFAPVAAGPIKRSGLTDVTQYDGVVISFEDNAPGWGVDNSETASAEKVRILLRSVMYMLRNLYMEATKETKEGISGTNREDIKKFTEAWEEIHKKLSGKTVTIKIVEGLLSGDGADQTGSVSARYGDEILFDKNFLENLLERCDGKYSGANNFNVVRRLVAERLLHELSEDPAPEGKSLDERARNEARLAGQDLMFMRLLDGFFSTNPSVNRLIADQKMVTDFFSYNKGSLKFRSGYYYRDLLRKLAEKYPNPYEGDNPKNIENELLEYAIRNIPQERLVSERPDAAALPDVLNPDKAIKEITSIKVSEDDGARVINFTYIRADGKEFSNEIRTQGTRGKVRGLVFAVSTPLQSELNALAANPVVRDEIAKNPAEWERLLDGRVYYMTEEFRNVIQSAAKDSNREIVSPIAMAENAGQKIMEESRGQYKLILPYQFFAKEEFQAHEARYGDRFSLIRVSDGDGRGNNSSEQYIKNALNSVRPGEEGKAIVLVSSEASSDNLKLLTKRGIRFVRIEGGILTNPTYKEDAYRASFQLNTYAVMLLTRSVNAATSKDSPTYKLLSFYLKSHFSLDGIAIDEYIAAIIANDDNSVAKLIKGYLSYVPITPYDAAVEYKKIAATLISA